MFSLRKFMSTQSQLQKQTPEDPMRPLQDINQIKHMNLPCLLFAVLKDPEEGVHFEFTPKQKLELNSGTKTLGLSLLHAQQVITSAEGNAEREFPDLQLKIRKWFGGSSSLHFKKIVIIINKINRIFFESDNYITFVNACGDKNQIINLQDRPGLLFHRAYTKIEISIQGSDRCMIITDNILHSTVTKYEIARFIIYNIIKEKIFMNCPVGDSDLHFISNVNNCHLLANMFPFLAIKDVGCWANFLYEFQIDEYDDFEIYKKRDIVNY